MLIQSHNLAAREAPESPVPVQLANPTKVALVNQIDAVLTIHCELNYGEDLGSHALPAFQTREHSFQPKFDWINRMTCSFLRPGRVQDFDLYKQTRDVRLSELYWLVGTSGLCRIVDTTQKCFPWN
ncbi:hypothetical protein MLD38_035048 [Melastoma candidum]|uniref:Uncharacterized protein n=1 Tax=Melastoma candidum TaxID=119954 RepID=A0ACB9MCK1_9MYRT|nr:hypothetical protein MLD38_035048 [Melastoma candidum]